MDGLIVSPKHFFNHQELAAKLTASLELEVEDVEEGDSGEEEGEERSEGDGEEEFDEVLLWGADGRTTRSSSSS